MPFRQFTYQTSISAIRCKQMWKILKYTLGVLVALLTFRQYRMLKTY